MIKQYRVTACYTVYCYATVKVMNEDEAYALAKDMDGGDFEIEEDCGLSDWHIDCVREIPTTT
jgi:chemotaxis protein CheY-P-specific phosphatase CheC